MTGATAMFVQFPHPGGEHRPPSGDVMTWNTGPHRRKFLAATGDYVDRDGRRYDDGDVAFWCEWEPPSRIEQRWKRDGRLPRALHRPYWTRPVHGGFRQNTDPWVFGDQMRYTNCKQTGPRPNRNPSAMQELPRGSVICFGSTLDGEFCLDTVFVVADHQPWTPATAADLDVDDAFVVCTGESIATADDDADLKLALYRGATIDDPVDGMYSFVPARRIDHGDPRFARPAICLAGIVNPRSTQSTRGAHVPRPISEVRDHWEHVRDQVLDRDLGIAVRLDTPHEDADGRAVIPTTTRKRC